MARKLIQIESLSKTFHCSRRKNHILEDISFDLYEGQIVGIIGPSGCGKTTLLKMIANLEKPSNGTIKRNFDSLGFVFQDLRIFPWLTVMEHLDLILRNNQNNHGPMDKATRHEMIYSVLRVVGLHKVAQVKGGRLSGGMKKRVEIARALIVNSELILFDEALSNLDYLLRFSIIKDLKKILTEQNKSAIYVTHDIREAIYISNRLLILAHYPATITQIIDIQQPISMEEEIKLEKEILNTLGIKSFFDSSEGFRKND